MQICRSIFISSKRSGRRARSQKLFGDTNSFCRLADGQITCWGTTISRRLASRIGEKQARIAAMLLLTLRGTPTLYYGDELGMQDVPITPEQVQDPAEKNEPGKGRGRDPERSPMLWVNAPNAGFTTAEATPWLPLESDWATRNAAAQRRDSTVDADAVSEHCWRCDVNMTRYMQARSPTSPQRETCCVMCDALCPMARARISRCC